MRRREFIAGLGSAAAWPVVARTQQPAKPIVGFIYGGSPSAGEADSLRKGLAEAGYFEGRNVTVEYHWLDGKYDRSTALARELIERPAAVIVAASTPVVLSVKAVTSTVPIVFNIGGDAVKLGLVASYSRPGGNSTGVSILSNAMGTKNLQLLHELLPQVTAVAMLVNPASPNAGPDTADAQSAARILGLRLLVSHASDRTEIEVAFADLERQRVGALLVGADPFFAASSQHVVELAAGHRIPAIYNRRDFAASGGLMSYGTNFRDAMRQVGVYAGRILKGEKPADLPVVQPTQFELVINLKTAKALGLTIPEMLLATADEVIQ
jgi:putative tryptophan/tyrosine transport system substrate-binding protein